jgi:hypothetical protein
MTAKTCDLHIYQKSVLNEKGWRVQVGLGVCGPWFVAVEMLAVQRGVDIENKIDPCGCEIGHADIVILCGINGVNTDSGILDVRSGNGGVRVDS